MDKKLTIKRIIIFTALAYLLSAVWNFIFLYCAKGPDIYKDPTAVNPYASFSGFSMLGPAAAVFITRAVTKEGMKHSMLKFNIKGRVKHYILPIAVLTAVAVINSLTLPIVTGNEFYFKNDHLSVLLVLLNTVVSSVFMIGLYFGEEYGWRGYLFPKLEQLIGTGKALAVLGVIWGIWHTPVLLKGHNFGTDMPLFPVSNIVLMCVMCIFISPILAYFSKKCDSVWPAAIAHAFFNNFVGQSQGLFIDPDILGTISSKAVSLNMLIGIAAVGCVFYVLMLKDARRSEAK